MNDIDVFLETVRDVREYKRAIVVSLVFEGYDEDDIALMFRVSVAFIRKWSFLYKKNDASIFRLAYTGGTPYLAADERERVLDWLRTRDQWSMHDLRTYLETEFSIVFASDQSYYALLHDAEFSYKKAQMTNPKADPLQVEQKKRHNGLP